MLKVCNDMFSVLFCVPFMYWINWFAKKSSFTRKKDWIESYLHLAHHCTIIIVQWLLMRDNNLPMWYTIWGNWLNLVFKSNPWPNFSEMMQYNEDCYNNICYLEHSLSSYHGHPVRSFFRGRGLVNRDNSLTRPLYSSPIPNTY